MPEDVAQSAVEIHTTDATQAQKTQAAQEIDADPTVTDPPVQEPADYSELKLDQLRAELERRELPTSGNKAELAARLAEHDATQAQAEPADQAVNGGIRVDLVSTAAHADVLQGLSDDRRSAQLKATKR